MSDYEDLYLNEFFSTFPLPDSPSLLPFLFEDLESQPLENPNSYVPSDTFDYSVPFGEADGGAFMSESQTLAPALHDPASLVDDGSLVDFSAWINETPSNFLDPSLLGLDCYDLFSEPRHDMSFADSSIFNGEVGPLDVADLEQPESASHSITPPEPEDLELMETQNSIPFESELAISTASTRPNNTTMLQKRKVLGPSREYELPRKKKRGIAAGMTQAKQGSRTKKGNVCITCRKRNKKCNDEIPCDYCLENLGPQLLKEPCTKVNFLAVVEEKSCFEFSNLHQDLIIEKCNNASFLELSTTVNGISRDRLVGEMISKFLFNKVTFISWQFALSQFQAFLELVKDEKGNDINSSSLPPLASIIKRAPIMLRKKFMETGPQNILNPDNLDHLTLLTHRLICCMSPSLRFKIRDLTGAQLDMSNANVAQAAAQLIDWLAVQHCEIEIFSYLQKSVNKLNKLSTSDLYDFIALLVAVVGIHSATSDSPGMILYPKQKSLDQETIKQLTNRRQCLLLALLFHADIAISKLPSWSRSDNWKELEKRIRFIEHKLRREFNKFGSSWSLLQVKNEQVSHLFSRIFPPFKNPKRVDPEDFDGQCCLDDWRSLQNGAFDKGFEKFDLLYMDGLLSKTMPGGFYEVQLSMFFILANIDWQLAVASISSRSFGTITLNDIYFNYITRKLEYRSFLTECCYIVEKICDRVGVFTEDSVQYFEWHIKDIFSTENTLKPASHRKELRKILLDLREGFRWLKLKSLTGGEEIYLLGTPLRAREIGWKIGLLDIPYTLKHGNDEEFDGLIKLLEPSQSWIRKVCVQLRGVVRWIKEVTGVCISDRDPLSLSQLIQRTVNHTFAGINLKNKPSERHPSLEIESFFGASSDAVAKILRDIVEKGGNLSFDDGEDDSEDNSDEEDEGIHEEIALLIKSIRSFLLDLHNAQKSGTCPE